jgi:hypothetical protein
MALPAVSRQAASGPWISAIRSRPVLFAAALAMCFLFLVVRTPYSFFEPVFFAEDGTDYSSDIANNGFMAALVHTHNGYFVFGNVLLSGVAFFVDRIFLRGDVRQIPWAMSLVSGFYFASLAALPIVLLRSRVSIVWLFCLAALLVGTPLGVDDSVIIGRLSNIGYSCVYLAVILIAYRIYERPSGIKVLVCDLALFICANTNPAVFPLLALAALPYAGRIARGPRGWKELLRDRSFLSLVILGMCVVTAAAYLAVLKPLGPRNHLNEPFIWANAIEMLLAREMLYPLLVPIYSSLKDMFVVCLAVVIFAAVAWIWRRQTWEENKIYAITLAGFSIFAVASAVFRPGLSARLHGYDVQPLHQYFYGMNLISTLLIVLLCHDLTQRLSIPVKRAAPALVLALYAPGIVLGGGFGRPDEVTTGPPPFSQDVTLAVATGRYATREGVNAADGPDIMSLSPPYLGAWCRIFVPKGWALASVKRDSTIEFAQSAATPISMVRVSRGLDPTAGSHVKARVAQLGFIRSGCTWIHEASDSLDTQRTAPGSLSEVHFDCRPGDVAVIGDWTGTGKATVGIFRKGLWMLEIARGPGKTGTPSRAFTFGGLPGDIPVTGDWNGDGRTKVGIYRSGTWLLDFNGNRIDETAVPNSGDRTYSFGGLPGDVPVVGDWNGSGQDKIGLFRSGFLWVLDNNGNGRLDGPDRGGDISFPLGGLPGDIPVTGDWNGDGRTKTGIFRHGQWTLDLNGSSRIDAPGTGQYAVVLWTAKPGDVPIVLSRR